MRDDVITLEVRNMGEEEMRIRLNKVVDEMKYRLALDGNLMLMFGSVARMSKPTTKLFLMNMYDEEAVACADSQMTLLEDLVVDIMTEVGGDE